MLRSVIRRLATIAGLATLLAVALPAQPSNGYLFFGPGGYTCCHNTAGTLQFGAGGEYVIGKGVGVGGELGAVALQRDFIESVSGTLSANGYYHFRRGNERADPFVTGGYTLLFRGSTMNLGNFGGGLNYWFRRSIGLRVEVRDLLSTSYTTQHWWGVRFGIVLR